MHASKVRSITESKLDSQKYGESNTMYGIIHGLNRHSKSMLKIKIHSKSSDIHQNNIQ